MLILLNLTALLVLPFWLSGVINRVKSLWSGRRGPPVFQLFFDVKRLLHKTPVYSATTTPLFCIAPYAFLISAVGSAMLVPLTGLAPVISFPFDFVWFAYVWALGRMLVMLAALDTGSPFEGMGAAREATFSTLLEPVVFVVTGALGLLSRSTSLQHMLAPELRDGAALVVWVAALVSLTIVLQVEAARMPIDDPSTHLELTMIHEVMILDHSGPDLAAIQVGAALKLAVGASILAALMNPWAGAGSLLTAGSHFVLCTSVAIVIGTVESLTARLKLRAVPVYIGVGLTSGLIALVVAACRAGGTP